jgi:hypothetical protein
VVETIKKNSAFSDIIIIGCTSYAEEAWKYFLEAGCDAVWTKPMPTRYTSYIYMYLYIYVHVYIYVYIYYVLVYIYICLYIRLYGPSPCQPGIYHIYIYVYILCTCIYIYVYIYMSIWTKPMPTKYNLL